MFTLQLIDRTIKFVDNLDPAVGDHVMRRSRYLQHAQDGVVELWTRRNWFWTKGTFTPTILINTGSVALPSTFMEVGRDGKVFITALGEEGEMTETFEEEIQRAQQSGITTSQPEKYCIFGHNDLGLPLIQTQKVSANTGLTIRGRQRPPVLADTGVAGSGLELIPDHYAFLLLIPWMRWRGYDDAGDKRADLWETRYERAISKAALTEKQGKETLQEVPGYGLSDMC